jgi:hypothetical protein
LVLEAFHLPAPLAKVANRVVVLLLGRHQTPGNIPQRRITDKDPQTEKLSTNPGGVKRGFDETHTRTA